MPTVRAMPTRTGPTRTGPTRTGPAALRARPLDAELRDPLTDTLAGPAQRVVGGPVQREPKPSPAGEYYHATTANAWVSIRESGLDPNFGGNGKGWSTSESTKADSVGKVFFNRSLRNAKDTARELAHRPDSGGAVVLKFSAEDGELQTGDTMGGDWTTALVPASRLEVVASFEQTFVKPKGKCFLTTACCEARGLSDDCYELTTLRRFRDEVLLATGEGRALVEAYYRVAPAIVGAIHADGDGAAVLDEVYADVLACCAHVEAGRHEAAVATYTAMVEGLRRRYEEELAA